MMVKRRAKRAKIFVGLMNLNKLKKTRFYVKVMALLFVYVSKLSETSFINLES